MKRAYGNIICDEIVIKIEKDHNIYKPTLGWG